MDALTAAEQDAVAAYERRTPQSRALFDRAAA